MKIKKSLFLLSIFTLILVFASCTLFERPINITQEIDEGHVFSYVENIVLNWTSDADADAGVTYNILFGTSRGDLEFLATDLTSTEYELEKWETGITYYWRIVAVPESGNHTLSDIFSFSVEEFTNYNVTNGRGGPTLEDYEIYRIPNDFIITKEGYSTARIQDVKEEFFYEVPLRDIVNPDWTDAPKILINGIEANQELNGIVEFDLEVITGKNEAFVFYVYFAAEGRGPSQGYGDDSQTGSFAIDTRRFPNGDSYVRFLAYNNNGDAVLTTIPISFNNEVINEDVPGAVNVINVFSITLGENLGYYSNPNQEESKELLINSPFGEEIIVINQFNEFMTVYNTIDWAPVEGALGYNVYRSFDSENWRRIGSVDRLSYIQASGQLGGRYRDFSSELDVGKKTYYKVVPYNTKGSFDGESVIRWVIPAPGIDIELLSPSNKDKGVSLTPNFEWNINHKGHDRFNIDREEYTVNGNPIFYIEEISYLHIFDLNWWRIYETFIEDDLEYQLPEGVLEPGNAYSWDINDAEIYVIYQNTANGFSYSWSYTFDGALNGEFLFTTELPDDNKNTDTILPNIDFFNYDNLEYSDSQILVKFSDRLELGRLLREYNTKILNTIEEINWAVVEVPKGVKVETFIAKLLNEKEVIIAQPDFIEYIIEPEFDEMLVNDLNTGLGEDIDMYKLWGLENIRAPEAWEITTGSEDVVLAIIDTGVDISHPEFKNLIPGFDATGEDLAHVDYNGHGTHVAGTAGAYGREGIIAGVAWDSPILPIRVMNSEGRILSSYLLVNSTIYSGLYAAATDKRVVINMSIGGRGYNFAFQDAIDFANDMGVVFVTSAGNDTKRIPSFPTSYSGVIQVAATTPTNDKADFSTIGPWTSVGAPGVSIYSALPGGGYGWMQGTSMAAPHVAGAAALLLSEFPELTPIQVKNQLEQTANDHGRGWTEEFGYGIIDVYEMLKEIKPNKYGALYLQTNLHEENLMGIVTVFSENDILVGWGLTGEFGYRLFNDLKEGNYTYYITYYHPILQSYTSYSNTVDIIADEEIEVVVEFSLPELQYEVIERIDVDIEESIFEHAFTVEEEGWYSIETLELDNPNEDTILELYDSEDNLIARNVDKSATDYFSLILIALTEGEYVVKVIDWEFEVFEEENPLNFTLEISRIVLDE